MKITLLLILSAVFAKAQCGFIMPSSTTVCINTDVTIYALGASGYTWSYNGGGLNYSITPTDTSKFTHNYGWTKQVKLTAELNGCVESITITITPVACAVGIKEYYFDPTIPTYIDIFGVPSEKKENAILIEQRSRKKVLFY